MEDHGRLLPRQIIEAGHRDAKIVPPLPALRFPGAIRRQLWRTSCHTKRRQCYPGTLWCSAIGDDGVNDFTPNNVRHSSPRSHGRAGFLLERRCGAEGGGVRWAPKARWRTGGGCPSATIHLRLTAKLARSGQQSQQTGQCEAAKKQRPISRVKTKKSALGHPAREHACL
jgi:hypothetical protein